MCNPFTSVDYSPLGHLAGGNDYYKYTGPQRLDKAMHTLEGIVTSAVGIT